MKKIRILTAILMAALTTIVLTACVEDPIALTKLELDTVITEIALGEDLPQIKVRGV